jgi:hypothetical protein
MTPSLCNAGDIRNVTATNDTEDARSYAPSMTDRTRREQVMKRIATIAAVLTTAVVAVPVAAGGNNVATKNTQVVRQVVGVQVANTQVVRTKLANRHRVTTAAKVQRHRVQILRAQRWTLLRAQLR